jgi:hypothetical protein
MHRSRLFFLLPLAVAFALTGVAQAQDGTRNLDDQIQNKFSDKDQDNGKAKKQDKDKVKNDDGHRRHWYSLPHFRHKKHDNESAARQPQNKSNTQTAAAQPMPKPAAMKPAANRSAAFTNASMKTDDSHSAKNTAESRSRKNLVNHGNKTMATKKAGTKTVAMNQPPHKTGTHAKHAVAANTTGKKTMARTGQTKKPVRHNCSADESKKDGCQTSQHAAAKATTHS